MSPFFAGTLFGFLFCGAFCVVFITRSKRSEARHEPQWDDPFGEPALVTHQMQPQKLVNERTFK